MDVVVKTTEEEDEEGAPTLEFHDYALAFHFAADWKRLPVASKKDGMERGSAGSGVEPMESYERDLLLYAHRDDPPFYTLVVPVPAETATLTARFPAELLYESEQRRVRLRCWSDGRPGHRCRTFSVFASETIFERSRIVVLEPYFGTRRVASHDSQLNEFDLIKLIKLWEGGEGRPAPDWEKEILFETAAGESKTLEETARQLFRDCLPGPGCEDRSRALRGAHGYDARDAIPSQRRHWRFALGPCELYVPESEWLAQLFLDIAALKEGGDAPGPGSTARALGSCRCRRRRPSRAARLSRHHQR